MDATERGRLLYKLADLMERDRTYLAVSNLFILFTRLLLVYLLLLIVRLLYKLADLMERDRTYLAVSIIFIIIILIRVL